MCDENSSFGNGTVSLYAQVLKKRFFSTDLSENQSLINFVTGFFARAKSCIAILSLGFFAVCGTCISHIQFDEERPSPVQPFRFLLNRSKA